MLSYGFNFTFVIDIWINISHKNQTSSFSFLFSFLIWKQIFINNEFVDSVSGRTFPTINPATGKKICDIAEGDKVGLLKI